MGLSVYSKGENDNWYFGDKAAVNFAGTPVALTNSVMNAYVACGSISDAQGNLLFYTDGINIWDRDHNIMPNGTGLTGKANSTQTLIIGDSVNKDRYYVFSTAAPYNNQSYTAYSVVDMSLGSLGVNFQPLGDVDTSVKNVPVLDNNGNPITTGLNTTPVVNTLIVTTVDGVMFVNVSPFVSANAGFDRFLGIGFKRPANGTDIDSHRFDSSTGSIVYNFPYIGVGSGSSNSFSVEFSNDGTIVYSSYSINSYPYNVVVGVDILAFFLINLGHNFIRCYPKIKILSLVNFKELKM